MGFSMLNLKDYEIKIVNIEDVKEYETNPRNNTNAIEAVANSIKEFGFQHPILVDNKMEIIAGHTRLKASQKLGLKEVPIRIINNLSEEQIKAFRLVDNKTAELADWNEELLMFELENINNIDMDLFGFDLELENEEEKELNEIIEDDVPEVDEESEPAAKLGDIWQLGNHRLMCGDSTSENDVNKLMNGYKADMVFTDPPYGMKKEKDGVLNDNLNYDDLLEFNKQWFNVVFEKLKDTGCLYCWGIDEPLMDMYSSILKPLKRKNQLVIRNYITWAKHAAFGINSSLALSYPKETEKAWFVMKGMDWNNNNAEFFNTKYEKILDYMVYEAEKEKIKASDIKKICGVQMFSHWFTKSQFTIIPEKHYISLQKAYPNSFKLKYKEVLQLLGDDNSKNLKPYFNNITENKVGDIGLTDVWRFSITSAKERELAGEHATPKPIALCSRAIIASSRKNEIVLDVFGGSGSTLIACEQLDRYCYMMELDPKYCDVIVKRWETLTGRKAILLNE